MSGSCMLLFLIKTEIKVLTNYYFDQFYDKSILINTYLPNRF